MVFGYNRVRRLSRASPTSPFPWRQMFVLALCRIAEPIAFTSIFPYIYYMIEDFGIAKNDSEIAIYAGMVTSAFTFAEFSAAVLWGRLSDIWGRKPVLLIGLAGTGISMFIFGFAKNFQTILIARALGGLLNGNVGVLQTTVAEVVKAKEHQALAYSIMPFIWTLGSIVGSALGGLLADPVKNYPNRFSKGTIWDAYPYLLPNVICAAVVCAGLVAGLLFLEETNEQAKASGRKDYGLVLGRSIENVARRVVGKAKLEDDSEERAPLLQNGNNQNYSTAQATSTAGPDPTPSKTIKKPSFKDAFTNQVILQIIAYGVLAYHTMAFEQLFPVLLSMPKATEPAKDPIHFTGGFGLPSSTIGLIYSLQGFYNMFCQISMFPYIAKRVSSLTLFRWLCVTWPIWYIVMPYVVLLPQAGQWPAIAFLVVVKITYNAFAYPANALLLANHAPSLLVLGSINGVAASIASLFRALGPSLEGLAQSIGLDHGIMGLGWWTTAVTAIVGGILVIWMTDPDAIPAEDQGETAVDEHESLADAADLVFRRGSHMPPTGPEGQTLIENEEMAISFAAGTHHNRKMSTASRFGPAARRFSLVEDHARRLSASAASMQSGRG